MRQHRKQAAFSIVDVMMGATILVVGLMGLIQAVTIGSEMLATARRQTLAAQILDHEIEELRFAEWSTIANLPGAPGTTLYQTWSSSTAYKVSDTVIRSGNWYRCIASNTGSGPPNTTYWASDTPPFANQFTSTSIALGATYVVTRTADAVTGATNLREVTFTVEWTVKPSGITSRTYTRKKSTFIGKYGLNLGLQRQ